MYKTLFILDWDDTIFPTTWIKNNNEYIPNSFQKIDQKLYYLLSFMKKKGDIIIITNAMKNWIDVTTKLLPKSYNIIKYIDIISAREMYQNKGDIHVWKLYAFRNELIKRISNKYIYNIISIGDADYEYHALINFAKMGFYKKHYIKSVKLTQYPSKDELLDQMRCLFKSLNYIYTTKKHLDLILIIKK